MQQTVNRFAKKLGIRSGMGALIVGAPAGYRDLLAPLPDGVTVSDVMDDSFSFVQLFAIWKAELRIAAQSVLPHVVDGSLVWITYPKKTSGIASDLSREAVREAMGEIGWEAVSIIAIDEVWSALRFRRAEEVKRSSAGQN